MNVQQGRLMFLSISKHARRPHKHHLTKASQQPEPRPRSSEIATAWGTLKLWLPLRKDGVCD